MPTPRVIDLSHHNQIPESLKPAAAAGIWGVIHKATEGDGFVDSKFKARRSLAEDAGLLFGAYHFIRPGNAKAQACFFIDTVQPDDDTLLALDYEDAGVELDQVEDFLSEVLALTDQLPVLYSGHVLKEKLGDRPADEFLSQCRLWLAQYGPEPKLPSGFRKFFLWQYTDRGTVPGVNPPTDLNAYDGTKQSLALDWTDREVVPTPARTVTVTIAAPADVNVVVKQV